MSRWKALLAALCCMVAVLQAPAWAEPFEDGLAAYRRSDYASALQTWRPLAEKGNARAQCHVGLMYADGRGVPQDDKEAAAWYRRAADQGFGFAQHYLGLMYRDGRGVPQDDKEAVVWYRKAADQGIGDAQYYLGWMYEDGRGVPQDDKEAVAWYRKAANRGNAIAQYYLGVMYESGRGVTQNDKDALAWYRKSADQGNARAQCYLGVMYESGHGAPQDDREAVAWYRKAADQGDAHAQNNLGGMYLNGQGVPQDDEKAAAWYRKGADQGNAAAQFGLGMMYEQGRGVEKDEAEALRFYRLAAAQKNAPPRAREGLARLEKSIAQNKRLDPPALAPPATPTRTPTAPSGLRKVALVIGNAAYTHSVPLDTPRNDATAIAETLTKMGFSVVSGAGLDKQEMERKARQFTEEARRADIALFYYAGHAIQVSGQNYLVPVDAQVSQPSAVDVELLNMAMLTNYMGGENKIGIVLLDASRNNPFAQSLAHSLAPIRTASVGSGLAAISAAAGGMLIGFAAAPDDVAEDGAGQKNSPFTAALLKHLPTPGLHIETVMKRLEDDVAQTTRNAQRPWHNSSLTREVVLLPAR